ncbi:MAG: hypothetical protein GX660_27890 [Clostridiaceae bacterium]|nr:hypothetical protein [Clostridiaceae bacterium]
MYKLIIGSVVLIAGNTVLAQKYNPAIYQNVADVNNDGKITEDDIDAVRKAINFNDLKYDVNKDGIVNIFDFVIVKNNLGWKRPDIEISSFDDLLAFSILTRQLKELDWKIQLTDNIVFNKRVVGPRLYGKTVSIEGNNKTIDMTAQDFQHGMTTSLNVTNGIDILATKKFTIRNVTIQGFDGGGSAIKLYVGDSPSGFGGGVGSSKIVNVTFRNIGDKEHPFFTAEPITISYDCWCSQPIGGISPILTVMDCTFDRCCLNNFYAHCVYVKGDQLFFMGNKTIKSGHPIKFTYQNLDAPQNRTVITGNEFNLSPVRFRTSEKKLPAIWLPYQPITAAHNVITWEKDNQWHGDAPLWDRNVNAYQHSLYIYNTYIGDMNIKWWYLPHAGKPISIENWKKIESTSTWK